MSVLTGLRTGFITDLKQGLNGHIYPPATVDGPGSVYTPASAGEWRWLGLPPPFAQWDFQDSSGNAVPTIGSVSLTATGGSITYRNTTSGWTRKSVFLPELGNRSFLTTHASFDMAAGESWAYLWYSRIDAAPAAPPNKLYAVASGGIDNAVYVTTDSSIRSVHNTLTAEIVGDNPINDGFFPTLWYRNALTNVSGIKIVTQASGQLTATTTHDETAFAGGPHGVGATSGLTPVAQYHTFMACWKGSDAETIATGVDTLTILGW